MNFINRNEIANGVYFTNIKDSRFKTMKISVNIVVPLSAETASENALVGGLLVRSCKKYPDFTVLSKKLSSLYGADLTSSLSKHGESQVIKISVSGLDDRYSLDDVSIAKELSELLCSVIFEPNVKNNAFIEQERRQLLDVIDSEFNEKRIYAMGQLIKHMCKDEVFGIKRYGTAEKIKAATAESLCKAWQNLLKTAKFEILYIGDSPADKAKEVFAKAFANIERNVVTSKWSSHSQNLSWDSEHRFPQVMKRRLPKDLCVLFSAVLQAQNSLTMFVKSRAFAITAVPALCAPPV